MANLGVIGVPLLLVSFFSLSLPAAVLPSSEWIGLTGNDANTRSIDALPLTHREAILTRTWNVTVGTVSVTATQHQGLLFFPTLEKLIYCLCAKDGSVRWVKNVSSDYGYNKDSRSLSKSSPLVWQDGYEEKLIIFIQNPADILVVALRTGEKLWNLTVANHSEAVLTQTGRLVKEDNNWFLYQGVSSIEEGSAASPTYPCCSFVGNFNKINLSLKKIVWKWYTIDPSYASSVVRKTGFAGNGIWGSSPIIYEIEKEEKNVVVFATGNLYSAPNTYTNCVETANAKLNIDDRVAALKACNAPYPYNWFESVVALDTEDGTVVWATKLSLYDAWTFGCFFGNVHCPNPTGPDYDFGMAPSLGHIEGKPTLFIGQKSGQVYALDCDNGSVIWQVQAGPGGTFGGISWGGAADETTLYYSLINSLGSTWNLVSPAPGARDGTNYGGWVAVDKATGNLIWQQTVPTTPTYPHPGSSKIIVVTGPPALIGGVLFTTSGEQTLIGVTSNTPNTGAVYTINAMTGQIISSVDTSRTIYGGFSLTNHCAYVGQGYIQEFGFTQGFTYSSFCFRGRDDCMDDHVYHGRQRWKEF